MKCARMCGWRRPARCRSCPRPQIIRGDRLERRGHAPHPLQAIDPRHIRAVEGHVVAQSTRRPRAASDRRIDDGPRSPIGHRHGGGGGLVALSAWHCRRGAWQTCSSSAARARERVWGLRPHGQRMSFTPGTHQGVERCEDEDERNVDDNNLSVAPGAGRARRGARGRCTVEALTPGSTSRCLRRSCPRCSRRSRRRRWRS